MAFLTAISAFAQETTAPASTEAPAAAVAEPAAAAAAVAVPAIEEVVVTAQRREQRLQDVPVAVTAADAEALAAAHVENIGDIQAVSPSINFDVTNSASNSANIRIRGIGTVGNSRAFEGAVGVFVDGVYRTRAGQALQNWVDIDSLEVLRGPQGTLFGKNTSAGALLVNSKAPSLAGTEGDYEFTFGNYNQILTRGALNAAVSDTVAVRVAGMWQTMDGFIENPNNGEDYNDRHPRALKAQVLWTPVDKLSLRLIADWSEEKANCCYGQVDAVDGPLQGYINGVLIPERGLKPPSSDFRDYEQVLSNNTLQEVEDKGAVLHADYAFDSGDSLHSVTAYRRWDISQMGMDADFTGANILTINETFATDFFSQEFTYNGKLDAFGPFQAANYVLGAYYSHEDIFATYQLLWGDQAQEYFDTLLGAQGYPAGTAGAPEGLWHSMHFPAKSESSAAFMHWDFTVTDAFSVIAGLRYSVDKKDGAYVMDYFTPLPNAAFTVLGAQPGPQFNDSTDDSAVTGTVGAQYRFTHDIMGYATYSRGYKSGGVNIDNTTAGGVANNPAVTPGAVPLDPTYKPEYVNGYELGLKTEYWGHRARTNVAVFYDDMSDLQVAQFSGTAFSVVNAPDATVYGAEVENNFLLTDYLNFNLAVTWLAKAEFGESDSIGLISGREFAQAPEFAGNASFDLNLPIRDGYSLISRLAAQYSGEQYTNTSNNYQRDAQTEYNASIGVRSLRGWSLSLWCQNCTDQRYTVQHFNSPLQGADANAYVSAPLTYGVTLRGSF